MDKKPKTFYCNICKKWMTEIYVSRHVISQSHLSKKPKSRVKNRKPRAPKSRMHEIESGNIGPPNKQYEHYRIDGSRLKKCTQNRLYESNDEALACAKQDTFQERPQNQLEILDWIDGCDFGDLLQDADNVVNVASVSVPIDPAADDTSLECSTDQVDQYHEYLPANETVKYAGNLIEIVDGVASVCTEFHNNQLAYHKCCICNPVSYKYYEHW